MAVEYDPKSNRFQVDYQAPFGGLDSTAYASSIDPHNFAAMDSTYVEDNYIKPLLLANLGTLTPTLGNYMGFIPLQSYSFTNPILGYVITDTTIYTVQVAAGVLSLVSPVTYAPALTGNNGYFHYITIDDIQSGKPSFYWTSYTWNEIWSFDTNTSTASLTTNYCGGGILGLLNNQLMNFGGYSQLDGDTPNRISWSAPGEYGQFKPFDVGSGTGSYSAGFNDLPSTSDILTGFAAIGTVGYLFRTQGITQINPTGNGLVPFQFNHLWASELGIGAPYPYTISQYGALVAFVSDSGLYTIGISGLNQLAPSAQTYIYNLFANNEIEINNLTPLFNLIPQAILIPYMVNSPGIMYVIAFQQLNTAGTVVSWQFIGVDVVGGKTYNLGNQINSDIGFPEVLAQGQFSYINPAILGFTLGASRQFRGLFITSSTDEVGVPTPVSFYTWKLSNSKLGTITFRKEIFKFGFVPTVSKIGILASLIDTSVAGTISFSVDGGVTFNTAFPDLNLGASSANGIIQTLFTDGVQSLERPQLTLKLTNIQVAEVWYQGTLADYPLI